MNLGKHNYSPAIPVSHHCWKVILIDSSVTRYHIRIHQFPAVGGSREVDMRSRCDTNYLYIWHGNNDLRSEYDVVLMTSSPWSVFHIFSQEWDVMSKSFYCFILVIINIKFKPFIPCFRIVILLYDNITIYRDQLKTLKVGSFSKFR